MSEAFARRYKLLDRIAIGGTAEVFRATFLTGDGEGRLVVIKRVLPQFARDERFRRLFHEEACLAVTMAHPSIVRVLDHGDIGPTCYIALELVEGKDLGNLLGSARASGQLPTPNLAAYIAAQVADALQFIHDQTSSEGTPLHIIHRDVSPQNILVSYKGEVKLTDFGIAKSAIRDERTVDGTLRGKLDYMSPEQAMLGEVDHRADIFGLGCVLYEMLEGQPPFRSANELETLEHVRQGQLRIPLAQIPMPDALRAVLDRSLQKERGARYQQAREMVADLRAFLANEVVPVTSEELGQWVTDLAAQTDSVDGDRVDEAVRQLLGQGTSAPASAGRRAAGTTVFASPSDPSGTFDVEFTKMPRPKSKRKNSLLLGAAFLAVALFGGICGWALWELGVFGGQPSPQPDQGVALDTLAPLKPDLAVAAPQDAAPVRDRFKTKGGSKTSVVKSNGWSFLTINSLPWSRVKIDGKFAGNTPLRRLRVKAGTRRIELYSGDNTLRRRKDIVFTKGKKKTLSFDFTK